MLEPEEAGSGPHRMVVAPLGAAVEKMNLHAQCEGKQQNVKTFFPWSPF